MFFSQIKDFLETKVFFVFTLFFCLAFLTLSYFTAWAETELYSVHMSKYLFTPFQHEFLFSLKPLFYLLLKISFLLSDIFNLTPMAFSRFLFALNGLVLLMFMYLYIKKKTNKYNAILAVLLIASSYIFLDRGFRVRSDHLCSSLSFFILWLNGHWQSDKKQYVFSALLLSLLFISLKGVYWIVLSLLLLGHDSKKLFSWTSQTTKTVLAFALIWITISFFLKDPFFIQSFSESIKYYIITLKLSYGFILNEETIKNFYQPFQSIFIKKNHFLILLASSKILFALYYFIKFKKIRIQDSYFVTLIFIALFHPEAKLSFFCALAPFFIIAFFTDSVWLDILYKSYSLIFKTILLAFLFLYSFSYITYFNYKIIAKKNNQIQKKIINHLNSFYKNTASDLKILDPACLIYSRKTSCKYLLYQDNFDQIDFVKKNNFDIILTSTAFDITSLLTQQTSNLQYVSIRNHILYKALIIDLKKDKYLHHNLENSTHENSQIKSSNRFLNGQKILKKLSQTVNAKSLRGVYFYTYIDKWNRSIKIERLKNETKLEHEKSTLPILSPFKFYSKEIWMESLIPVEYERLAIFYIPFPLDLKEQRSLRILLRYDFW